MLIMFSRYWALSVLGSRLDLSGSRDNRRSRDHSTRHRPFPIVGPLEPSLAVFEIFNGECDAMVDMTLIRPLNKSQGHSFWI